jgi:Cu(I)/Ag(I) efflux system periplasmic protein CusF
MTPSSLSLGLVAVVVGCLVGCGNGAAAHASSAPAAQSANELHQTRGVIRSFGPNRAYVNIAHEAIPGYMAAMTMSFEPREANQLAGLVAGDKVSFSFADLEDGRRVIEQLTKEE